MDEARAARSQMIRRAKGPVPKNANQNVQQQRKRTRSEQHSPNRVLRARKQGVLYCYMQSCFNMQLSWGFFVSSFVSDSWLIGVLIGCRITHRNKHSLDDGPQSIVSTTDHQTEFLPWLHRRSQGSSRGLELPFRRSRGKNRNSTKKQYPWLQPVLH